MSFFKIYAFPRTIIANAQTCNAISHYFGSSVQPIARAVEIITHLNLLVKNSDLQT